MNTFSAYVFRQALGPLLAILGALAAVALLTQGLNQLDIIIANRQSGFAFAWVTLLSMPQLISLILPLALFFAVLYALNRMHSESEIVVLYGAGLSRGSIARPILRLAVLAALAHLAIATVIQPAALRERRDVLYDLRTDVASSLVQEGAFTTPADNLTLYARERGAGGEMHDLMIDDARNKTPVTYNARSGAIATIDGAPAVVMRDGQIHRQTAEGTVEVLDFDRYVLQLGRFFREPELFYLKASDRYLNELFLPDLTQHYDQRNVDAFLAEGHSRMAAPLLNIALAMIALTGVLVGDFSRRGYARRIAAAAAAGLLLRLAAIAVQSAAAADPRLNVLQYALPIGAALVAAIMLGGKSARRKRRELGPALAGARG
ncbi:MAG TPA: LptF/LptG family permease [Caulobacterales bacterium]|nr:LptF/LptG family permease [Caulobacterales bacterium]